MKKLNNNNNKFRGNGNTIYSLNYKFDSVSSAGKLSGTALDLIKKYNELAKEAHNNGDYVQMEVFRQYAEHYRKIVTEINERKNQNRENAQTEQQNNNSENQEVKAEQAIDEGPSATNADLVETEAAAPVKESVKTEEKPRRRRSFTVIDVAAKESEPEQESAAENVSEEISASETAEKPRRRTITRRRVAKAAENTETVVAEN